VFEVTGLTKVFQLFDTVDDAVSGAGAATS
jgi:hypothetical protein